MFVKIVRKSSRGDNNGKVWKVETTYECENVQMRSSKKGLIFSMEKASGDSISVETVHGDPDFKEETSVYFMNRYGQTVDSYYLEPTEKDTTPSDNKVVLD